MDSAPALALPDFTKEFIVETDASGHGVDTILMQGSHPIAYIIKSFSEKYQSLSVYEKEMLAILMVIKKWEYYLANKHFVVKTDH